MKALNLFSFTRVEADYAAEYMNMLAARKHREKCRPHEFRTLKKLVEILTENGVSIDLLDGFFFSYSISQIGKEFDLLKIEKDRTVLNIELKCEPVKAAEMEKQLRQNRYYLGFAAPDIRLFTFVASTGELYELGGDTFSLVPFTVLIDVLKMFRDYLTEDIGKLFEPKQFLISPFTDPVKFIKGKYFLTQQQQDIREKILGMIRKEGGASHLFGITGGTGSGKTLLLYDIARTIAREGNFCCVLHPGDLCEGHGFLNESWEHVEIVSVRELADKPDLLSTYRYIFADEAHHMRREEVDWILDAVKCTGADVIFSYDNEPWLSRSELKRDIPAYLVDREGFSEWTLSRRIRTGLEIAAFYRNMLDLRHVPRGNMDYSCIDVLYAADRAEAEQIVHFYENHLGYTCANTQGSVYAAGQEYENVLVIIEGNHYYDADGWFRGVQTPEAGQESDEIMIRNVTRTRSRLCILVIENYDLFRTISGIKYNMLEKVLYKESIFSESLSGKQLTKLVKAVKESERELSSEDREIADDTVAIIQEQITRPDADRRILRNSLHFLERIRRENSGNVAFSDAAEEFIQYIKKEV